MDGCTRQDPAYRPATEKARFGGPSLLLAPRFRRPLGTMASSLGPRAAPPTSSRDPMRKRPEAAGLYDPSYEHDNCGIGAVADLTGEKKHETVSRALYVLDNLEHRGASGAEIDTGEIGRASCRERV